MPIEQVLIENLARYLIPDKVKTEITSNRKNSKISKKKS